MVSYWAVYIIYTNGFALVVTVVSCMHMHYIDCSEVAVAEDESTQQYI